MDLIESFFFQPYAWRALTTAVLVGYTCGLLGPFILLRRMALVGDALSHAILPGVVVAFMLVGYSTTALFTGSVIAGLVAALLITWIQRKTNTREDAAIGIIFSVMFAAGVMGISWLTHQRGVHLDLKDFLFGNLLSSTFQDTLLSLAIGVYVTVAILVFYRYFLISTFQPQVAETMGISTSSIHYFLMLLLSFTIVSALQSVGVILVVGMLVIPASAAQLISKRLSAVLAWSVGIGIFSTVVGMLLSVWVQTTPGPAMIIVAGIVYSFTVLFSPNHGILIVLKRNYLNNNRICQEDILKQLALLGPDAEISFAELQKQLKWPRSKLKRHSKSLESQNIILRNRNNLRLTHKGVEKAFFMIRAHRLWEHFLVHELGQHQDNVHIEAEEYEHFLPPLFINELENSLGNPQTDPHGSIIPKFSQEAEVQTLAQAQEEKKLVLLLNQPNNNIVATYWELGIAPNQLITVCRKTDSQIEVKTLDKSVSIPIEIANQTWVKFFN
ncbi:MAG: metal ABC transporter permease [Bacteroidia bacterium]|nr:metal ABC transporter permease [Bacteroidia bacterium]